MDDLLQELREAGRQRYKSGPPCGVPRVVAQIRAERGDTTADQLATRIEDPAVTALSITKTLARHGYALAAHTVRRHRRRKTGEGCTCP